MPFLHPLLCHCRAGLAIAGCALATPQAAAAAARDGAAAAGPWPANPLTGTCPVICACPIMAPGQTPVRVGIILPFSSSSAGDPHLAASMLKAAELAMFDARQPQHSSDDRR